MVITLPCHDTYHAVVTATLGGDLCSFDAAAPGHTGRDQGFSLLVGTARGADSLRIRGNV